jgi:hypothetical protein
MYSLLISLFALGDDVRGSALFTLHNLNIVNIMKVHAYYFMEAAEQITLSSPFEIFAVKGCVGQFSDSCMELK